MSFQQLALDGAMIAQIPLQGGGDLLWLAVVFLVLAVVAALLGAGDVAGMSMGIAKWLVIIFVVLAVITFIL